jgi:predicted nucleic acid-binding protein
MIGRSLAHYRITAALGAGGMGEVYRATSLGPEAARPAAEQGQALSLEDACALAHRVPDAHLAALLRQHGVKTLYTRDSDFRKLAFLEIRDPFA